MIRIIRKNTNIIFSKVILHCINCCNKIADGYASDEEIEAMQTFEYSKEHFDLQFPLLVRDDAEYSKVRYYAKPIYIKGQAYFMCSQWYETSANNDRPYLLRWIEEHIDRM